MKQLEVTGKSIGEAVDKAVQELGVGYSDIDFQVIDEPTKGFLGIGAKPAKVIVTIISEEEKPVKTTVKKSDNKKTEPKAEAKQRPQNKASQNKDKPKASNNKDNNKPKQVAKETAKEAELSQTAEELQGERANLTEEDKNLILTTATNFLVEIFNQMELEVDIEAAIDDNKHILINMVGDEMGTIIGKRGQTLDSLQYLTNLVVNRGKYPYMNVTLDTEGYRAKRRQTLERLAFNLAKKAKHNRRNVTLEPMNPYERRIIHATLQNDRYVTTYSEGVEPYRYVVIALKSSNKR